MDTLGVLEDRKRFPELLDRARDGEEPLVASIAAGRWRGVLSMATLMTLMEGRLRLGDEALAARYEAVFSDPTAWTLVSLTPQVALAAARLQRPGSHAVMAPARDLDPDVALELASALHGGATAMISRDPRLLAALPLPAGPPLS